NGAFVIYDETAAAWRFVIDSSGNVGIGTVSPSGVFHVETPINVDANQPRIFGSTISSGGSWMELLLGKSAAAGQGVHIRYVYGGGGANTGYLEIANRGIGNQIVIHANGGVGIGGVTTPQATLDVNGPIRAGSAATGNGCSPVGSMAYDPGAGKPIYCDN